MKDIVVFLVLGSQPHLALFPTYPHPWPVLGDHHSSDRELAQAISALAVAVTALALGLGRPQPATVEDLEKAVKKIMSKFTEGMAAIKAHQDRQEVAVDKLVTGLEGIGGDVTGLKTEIQELKETLGDLDPEAQAAFDALIARGESLTTRLEGIVATATALDDATPPPLPPEPPEATTRR